MMPWQPPNIAHLPLDGRPPNLHHMQRLAGIAGVELHTPPREALAGPASPADPERIGEWLDAREGECSHLLLSLDALCYGGLVQSRRARPRVAAAEVAERVKQFKFNTPDCEVYPYAVLPRGLPGDASGADPEELRDLLERLATRAQSPLESGNLPTGLGASTRRYLRRRFRYLRYLRELIGELGKISRTVVVGCDDVVSPRWVNREREWLSGELDGSLGDKLVVLDGADELAQMLLAKTLAPTLQDTRLPLEILYPEGLHLRGRFESADLARSLYRRCRFLGLEASHFRRLSQVEEVMFLVNWPQGLQADHLDRPEGEAEREELLVRKQIRKRMKTVLEDLRYLPRLQVADVAWANGGAPEWWGAFADEERMKFPVAYSGFNTSANALGSALATWVAARYPGSDEREQYRFALERMLDDFYYQVRFRNTVREELEEDGLDPDLPAPEWDRWEEMAERFTERCERFLERLDGMDKLPVEPGEYSVTVEFPWQRAFEAEVKLV